MAVDRTLNNSLHLNDRQVHIPGNTHTKIQYNTNTLLQLQKRNQLQQKKQKSLSKQTTKSNTQIEKANFNFQMHIKRKMQV